MKALKVGDRVRVKDSFPESLDYDKSLVGQIGTVFKVEHNGVDIDVAFVGVVPGYDTEEDPWTWWIDRKYLKLDTPKAKATKQTYLGNGKHEWEMVVEGNARVPGSSTMRLRVPGGWLYKVNGVGVYVPMPEVVKHKV